MILWQRLCRRLQTSSIFRLASHRRQMVACFFNQVRKKRPAIQYGHSKFSTNADETALAEERKLFKEKLKNYGEGSVDLSKDPTDGIAVITLNNPDKKNALSGKMMVDLCDVVEDLESWDKGKGVILMGAKGTFCSGGEFSSLRPILTPELGLQMSELLQNTLTRLLHLPMLSVALIQGNALGAGTEIMTACDFRIMTSTAQIGFIQLKMGVVNGGGGGTRLVRLIGKHNALKIMCSSRILESEYCMRVGLVDHVIPVKQGSEDPDHTLKVGRAWLSEYCHADTQLVRDMKTIVTSADILDYFSSLERERTVFSKTWGGAAQIKAFGMNLKHS